MVAHHCDAAIEVPATLPILANSQGEMRIVSGLVHNNSDLPRGASAIGRIHRGFVNVPVPLKQTIAVIIYLQSHDDLSHRFLVLGPDCILKKRVQVTDQLINLFRH